MNQSLRQIQVNCIQAKTGSKALAIARKELFDYLVVQGFETEYTKMDVQPLYDVVDNSPITDAWLAFMVVG